MTQAELRALSLAESGADQSLATAVHGGFSDSIKAFNDFQSKIIVLCSSILQRQIKTVKLRNTNGSEAVTYFLQGRNAVPTCPNLR